MYLTPLPPWTSGRRGEEEEEAKIEREREEREREREEGERERGERDIDQVYKHVMETQTER